MRLSEGADCEFLASGHRGHKFAFTRKSSHAGMLQAGTQSSHLSVYNLVYRSSQPGLSFSMSFSFQSRRHFLRLFSRWIAVVGLS